LNIISYYYHEFLLLPSILGVVTNTQSLSMMSLPDIDLCSMSTEGIDEFGTFQQASAKTKGSKSKAPGIRPTPREARLLPAIRPTPREARVPRHHHHQLHMWGLFCALYYK
jgi:hypothetical protein